MIVLRGRVLVMRKGPLLLELLCSVDPVLPRIRHLHEERSPEIKTETHVIVDNKHLVIGSPDALHNMVTDQLMDRAVFT